jgi:hypothetical protein
MNADIPILLSDVIHRGTERVWRVESESNLFFCSDLRGGTATAGIVPRPVVAARTFRSRCALLDGLLEPGQPVLASSAQQP